MTQILEQKIEHLQTRWNEIHNKVTSKAVKTVNATLPVASHRIYDTTDRESIPYGKIEVIGSVLVYPSVDYPGWWNALSEETGIVVSFSGELAHRNAIQFARQWSKEE